MDNERKNLQPSIGYINFFRAYIHVPINGKPQLDINKIPSEAEWEEFTLKQPVAAPEYKKPSQTELLEIFPESPKILPARLTEINEEIAATEENCKKVLQEKLDELYQDDTLSDKTTIAELYTQIYAILPIEILEKKLKPLEHFLRIVDWKRRGSNDDGTITDIDIARAKEFPITELVHANRGGFSRCPFHEEKTASFKIYKKDNRFHCFGCLADGDCIDLVMKQNGIDFISAVKKILNK